MATSEMMLDILLAVEQTYNRTHSTTLTAKNITQMRKRATFFHYEIKTETIDNLAIYIFMPTTKVFICVLLNISFTQTRLSNYKRC